MAPRPSWKGYLKLSLVSCAVALYPASTTSERVRFNTLNRKTGKLEIIRLVETSPLPVRRGIEALEDHRPKPRRVWNRLPDAVRDKVLALALDEPDRRRFYRSRALVRLRSHCLQAASRPAA